ncbi:MAG: DGQHR domain-containing protein [Chitinophagales bacterium]|nr:DGQHR domain-containing protein [Chitinophagales bacterium]
MTGPQLNERVWQLFEKAGFKTTPNSGDPVTEHVIKLSHGKERTPDLLAEITDLGVRLIGENTISKSLSEPFSQYVDDLLHLMSIDHSNGGLLVYPNVNLEESDFEYAKHKGIRVWQLNDLEYYETLVDTIGQYARYEMINSFGIETQDQTVIHNIPALRIHQPFDDSSFDLFLFSVNPLFLLKTCVVYRKAQGNKDAYQRMVSKQRLKQIKKFVTKSDSLLPPNIILHLTDSVRFDALELPKQNSDKSKISWSYHNSTLVILQIPNSYASLEILDGQHRLFGFADTEEATKKDFNLVVCGIKGLSQKKRKETFIAINDNARRMDANLVTFLKYVEDEDECKKDNELMAIKVVVLLNKTHQSPFKSKIKILDVGDQTITLKGFSGYDLKGLLGKSGLLRKYYKNDSMEYYHAFKMYFGMLKSTFKTEFDDPGTYVIFTNKGVSAFLKLLKSILKYEKKKLDAATVKKYIMAIKKHSSNKDWITANLKSKYAGSGGWKDFHKDLVRYVRKEFPSFKE